MLALAVLAALFAALMLNRKPPVKSLLVPEGYTLAQIDQLLAQSGILQEGGLINFEINDDLRERYWFLKEAKNLEGFLFPDTYEFFLDSSPEPVVKRFLNNFKRRTASIFSGKEDQVMDVIIMASMVEREVPDFGDDRPLVAGLLWRRLKINMPLQVDATICFVKNPLGCGDVLPVDLEIDSPYNTYLNHGLPPGPISNPGLNAINAAINPKESLFWFFLSCPQTKKTVFAQTYGEHKQNIVKYLK